MTAGEAKISLHQSGDWRFQIVDPERPKTIHLPNPPTDGGRILHRWSRPHPNDVGWTRALTITLPGTHLPAIPWDMPDVDDVRWCQPTVELRPSMTWRSLETAELPLEGRVDSWRIGWSRALRAASIRRLSRTWQRSRACARSAHLEPSIVTAGRSTRQHWQMDERSKKRLIVCLDGTWNGRVAGMPTNIARTANSLAHRGADGAAQIVCYLPGVGSAYRTDQIIGGLTGIGIRQQIITAYRFLSTNYEDGDEIYLFGFSRGAYAARSLANLLEFPGVPGPLPDGRLYDYLILLYSVACRAHLDEGSPADALVSPPPTDFPRTRRGRDRRRGEQRGEPLPLSEACRRVQHLLWTRTTSVRPVDIRFLGVYDTVGALGFAGERSHSLDLGPSVACARQALAIDERRTPFRPELWTTQSESNRLASLRRALLPNPSHDSIDIAGPATPLPFPDTSEPRPRVLQVWFRGGHSDVGGGAGEGRFNALSGMPWLWLLREAGLQGLGVDYHRVTPEISHTEERSAPPVAPMYWASNGVARLRQRLRPDQSFAGIDRVLMPPQALNVRIADVAVDRFSNTFRRTSWGGYRIPNWKPRGMQLFERGQGFEGHTEHVPLLPQPLDSSELLDYIPPGLRLAAGDVVERDRTNAEHWKATADRMEQLHHPKQAQMIRDRLVRERERDEKHWDW
jgi:uncharacterized protein (DUF2235 family)